MAFEVLTHGVIPDWVPLKFDQRASREQAYADRLKQAYLFFDSLIIPSLDETINSAPPALAADLEWLAEMQIVAAANKQLVKASRRDENVTLHESVASSRESVAEELRRSSRFSWEIERRMRNSERNA